jgi:hypothetical protein
MEHRDGTPLLGHERVTYSAEELLVQQVFGVDPAQIAGEALDQYSGFVQIVGQFSRFSPRTGHYETISPSRVAAVPAITERHQRLVGPARGRLSIGDIVQALHGNMPENDSERHPDHMFDIAQLNFGTDGPIYGYRTSYHGGRH